MDKSIIKFEVGSNKKDYKIKMIWDSMVYSKKLATSHSPSLYYPILQKDYPEKKNI